jgi:TetR/AcrR family transcriptional repressor of nem operon
MSKHAKFDRAEVIEKATNLYWEKGYNGTSMRNLQEIVDMRPGSIYATFGSKDNLFKEAINHYADASTSLLEACLDESESLLSGLKLFIQKIIIYNQACAPSGMCMIVKSVSELTENDNKELLNEAKRLFNNIEIKFADIITQAINIGEIDKGKDAIELARYVQIQVIGLRTYTRVNNNTETVKKLIDNIFLGYPFH